MHSSGNPGLSLAGVGICFYILNLQIFNSAMKMVCGQSNLHSKHNRMARPQHYRVYKVKIYSNPIGRWQALKISQSNIAFGIFKFAQLSGRTIGLELRNPTVLIIWLTRRLANELAVGFIQSTSTSTCCEHGGESEAHTERVLEVISLCYRSIKPSTELRIARLRPFRYQATNQKIGRTIDHGIGTLMWPIRYYHHQGPLLRLMELPNQR